jgi:outer membrane protein OmpA-like peptidoglycan-associated protein
MRLTAHVALAAGLAAALPRWAIGQDMADECRKLWASLEDAAQKQDIKAAAAGEREIAVDPICNSLSVAAQEIVLGLYKDQDSRLERAGAAPAQRLAQLKEALRYSNQWNAWDVHARIGDLMRKLPAANGQPNYAAISLSYDAALRAIDRAPRSLRPPVPEIQRVAALAYQFEALSPAPVPRRGGLTRTARQINVERLPVPLQFVYDKDELTEAGRAQAESLFEQLKEAGMPRLHLVGHTDPVGSDDYNDQLSVRRAAAVKRFLTDRSYPPERISTEGRGKRDMDKLRIWDRTEFTVDQVHQMLRRVELVWKD